MLYGVALFKNRVAALTMWFAMFGAIASNQYGVIDHHLSMMLLSIGVLALNQSEVNRIIASLFVIRVICMLTIFHLWYYWVADTILIVLQILIVLIGDNDDRGRRYLPDNTANNLWSFVPGYGGAVEKYRQTNKKSTKKVV